MTSYKRFAEWVGLGGPRPTNTEIADYLEGELENREKVDTIEDRATREAIKVLRATPPAAAEWQPIETAPTDGTAVELWHGTWRCVVTATFSDMQKDDCAWSEVTLTTRWPTKSFTHWRTRSAKPRTNNFNLVQLAEIEAVTYGRNEKPTKTQTATAAYLRAWADRLEAAAKEGSQSGTQTVVAMALEDAIKADTLRKLANELERSAA